MILLDTDIMIDILREYPPAISWLNTKKDEEICLPGFVVMELIQGCSNKIELTELKKELKNYNITWPSSEVCEQAMSIFEKYHLSYGIGLLDSLIGQLAVSLKLQLHTFNQKHYKHIPDLVTVQPYKK
ncbi:Ribonuclease VapC [Candidatus Magnetomoraceae bacterium gMMP-15]